MTAQDYQQEQVAGRMRAGLRVDLLDDCHVGSVGNHGRGCEDVDGGVRSVVCDAAIIGWSLGQQEIRCHVCGLFDWPGKKKLKHIL